MTENIFYALLSIRTAEGFESFGKFDLGKNKKAATSIFKQLKGSPSIDENTMLTIDLMETINELPLNLNILGCTLEEMAYNCKVIVKERFKLLNLKR